MWSPSKFIKMYQLFPGSEIQDSSVADPDPVFCAFFTLIINMMAWNFGYEYVVAK
jgi:hypothetical protein